MKVKRLKFSWLTAIALVLIAVTLTSVLVRVSDGFDKKFSDWSFKELNEDNLYQSLSFADTDGVFASGEDGITVELLEDNVLKVKGEAESTKTYTIGSITLKQGQSYVFDSGLKNGTKGTVYMSIRETSTDSVLASSYSGPVVVSAQDSDTAVTIELTVVKDTSLNLSVKPVFCIGNKTDDIVNYYK